MKALNVTRFGAAFSRRAFLGGMLGAACVAAQGALAGCSSSKAATGSAKTTAAGSSTEASELSITLFVFDTVVTIGAQTTQDVMDKISERCTYFENKFSRTVEGSDIWNINNAAGAPVQVAEETAEVIQAAIGYAEASGGLFDISIGAVSTLWDFVEGVKPTDEQIQAALPHVDYRCISVDGTTVTLSDAQAKLDLGGIAKGFITDDLVRIFSENGCKNASISLGGNVFVMGESFDGDPWNVGVQNPNGQTDDVIATIQAADQSLVTSGLYERCFEQDGTTYYHILDPKTGYPVKTDLSSASIETKKSVDGDAYSTILFLLGHDEALKLVNESDFIEDGVLVDQNNQVSTANNTSFKLL